jgi:hypothetical protein
MTRTVRLAVDVISTMETGRRRLEMDKNEYELLVTEDINIWYHICKRYVGRKLLVDFFFFTSQYMYPMRCWKMVESTWPGTLRAICTRVGKHNFMRQEADKAAR